ncbi:MAG: S8 family serine peptidase [Melioribacteraceae bacterium]
MKSNKNNVFCIALVFFFSSLFVFGQGQVIQKGDIYYLSGKLIVKLKEGNSKEILPSLKSFGINEIKNKFTEQTSALLKGENIFSRVYEADLDNNIDPIDASKKLRKIKEIEYAEPHYVYRITYDPNDSLYNQAKQEQLKRVFAPQAWEITKGDTNVVIGIVDTGVEWSHPDLAANIKINRKEIPNNVIDDDNNGFIDDYRGWDFGGLNNSPDNDPREDYSAANGYHGTHVAGIASAVSDNFIGIASLGFNSKILCVKASSDSRRDMHGYPFILYGFEGIKYAADNGAKVINCSWGGYSSSVYELEIINYAISKGALVVAANGNEGKLDAFYPASYPGVLAVGWLQSTSDVISTAANYGKTVDVFAPGSSILSTWSYSGPTGEYYRSIGGSSMSSPLTAGLAALVFSKFPNYTALQTAEQIRVNADNIDLSNQGKEFLMGRGRINAYNAVSNENSISVRGGDFAVINDTDGDGVPERNEQFYLTGIFTNYLKDVSGMQIKFETENNDIIIRQPIVSGINLVSGQSLSLGDGLLMELLNNAPYDDVIKIKITYTAPGYSDFQWINFKVNYSWENLTKGKLNLTVTSKGVIGFNDFPDNKAGIGLKYFSEDNVLFEGALIYGVNNTKLMDAARVENTQSTDFNVISSLKVNENNESTLEEAVAEFNDDGGGNNKLGIKTTSHYYSFSNPDLEDVIILRYDLTNESNAPIQGLDVGLFMDFDIPESDYGNDMAIWDALDYFAYSYDVNGLANGRYYAVAPIMHLPSFASYGYYGIDNSLSQGDVTLTDAFTKDEKWLTISSKDANTYIGPTDISFVVSSMGYDIPVGETIHPAFLITYGDNSLTIRNKVKAVRTYYNNILSGVEDSEENQIPVEYALYQNYPNPFNPTTTIYYSIPKGGNVKLEIYNALGEIINILQDSYQDAGNHTVVWNGKQLNGSSASSGIYFYRLLTNEFTQVRKMLLLK